MFFTENLGTVVDPEFLQRLSLEGSVMDDTLGLRAVNHLPELPDHGAMGEVLAQEGLKAAPSPDAFHGKWFKDQG